MKKHTLWFFISVATVCLLTAGCKQDNTYHHFEDIPSDGWQRTADRQFHIPAVMQSGTYDLFLDLRTTREYPYASITFRLTEHCLPANSTKKSTIECRLVDDQGRQLGSGISRFQYRYHLGERQLQKGDSLSISIRHHMQPDYLPGITDIGIELKNKQ